MRHKLQGMTIFYNKSCSVENCSSEGGFGWLSTKLKEFCKDHKELGMVDLRHPICESEGCTTRARYAYKVDTRQRCCIAHRLEGMVNKAVKICTYVGCRNTAVSQNKNDKVRLCKQHLAEPPPPTSSPSQQSETPVVEPSSALPTLTPHTASNAVTHSAPTFSTSREEPPPSSVNAAVSHVLSVIHSLKVRAQQNEMPIVEASLALPTPIPHTTSNIVTYNAATSSTSSQPATSQAGVQQNSDVAAPCALPMSPSHSSGVHTLSVGRVSQSDEQHSNSNAIDFTNPFIVVGVPGVQGVLISCTNDHSRRDVERSSNSGLSSSIIGSVENSVANTSTTCSQPTARPLVSEECGTKRTAFGVREEVDGNIMHTAPSDFPVKRMRLTEQQPSAAVE